jgi:preprotein translocase subunit SecF
MRFPESHFDFMGKRKISAAFSASLVLISLVAISSVGLNLGLDFTGGTLLEVEFVDPVGPAEVRQLLESNNFENGVVQFFGTERDLLIRMPPQTDTAQANLGDEILATLRMQYPNVVMRQSNYVGPAVGEELTEDGGLALLSALAVVMLYILFRLPSSFRSARLLR